MNFAKMMQQAQQVQARIGSVQEKLANTDFTGTAGGGAVTITLSGKGTAKGVKLDKSVVVADDSEMLEDLIAAAINDACTKKEAATNEAMKGAMGGLNLPPGLNLPF